MIHGSRRSSSTRRPEACGQGHYRTCSHGPQLDLRESRSKKTYCVCNSCGVQIFFRGKEGISRLRRLLEEHERLVGGPTGIAAPAIAVFDRLEHLRAQKSELQQRRPLILTDEDLEHTISAIDLEIARLQTVLVQMSGGSKSEHSREDDISRENVRAFLFTFVCGDLNPMPAKYNLLKLRALSGFEHHGWLSPPAWAVLASFQPARAAYSYLKRLHNWKFLDGTLDNRGLLLYRLSRRGADRLEWLRRRRSPGEGHAI